MKTSAPSGGLEQMKTSESADGLVETMLPESSCSARGQIALLLSEQDKSPLTQIINDALDLLLRFVKHSGNVGALTPSIDESIDLAIKPRPLTQLRWRQDDSMTGNF